MTFVNNQHNAKEDTEPIDTLIMPDGISASVKHHEVSSVLRATPNPAWFVLVLVHDGIREGSTFQDTYVEILVFLFK